MESVIKNALGIIIGNKDIEGADRIIYETGIYKAVVISVRANECFYFFLNIEVTLNLTLGCLHKFKYDIKFSFLLHFL